MKKVILALIFILSETALFAQNLEENPRPFNNIYINLLGDASVISVNYERLFFVNPTFALSGKLGLGYNQEFNLCVFGSCGPERSYLTIPHHITGNLGKGRHFFEFGLGGTVIVGNTAQQYLLYPIIGYRLQPLKSNRVNFRIFGQVPFSGLNPEDMIFVPLGVSVGISF